MIVHASLRSGPKLPLMACLLLCSHQAKSACEEAESLERAQEMTGKTRSKRFDDKAVLKCLRDNYQGFTDQDLHGAKTQAKGCGPDHWFEAALQTSRGHSRSPAMHTFAR